VRPYLKNNQTKKGWSVAQVVQHLPSKHKVRKLTKYSHECHVRNCPKADGKYLRGVRTRSYVFLRQGKVTLRLRQKRRIVKEGRMIELLYFQ
jgi:hypothetical protein